MLPKATRLTTKDIELLSQGKSVLGTLISMRYRISSQTKYAVSVSKKVVHTAVGRNKIRRRVYEAVRKVGVNLPQPAFIMFIPKKECLVIDHKSLVVEIETLFKKAGF